MSQLDASGAGARAREPGPATLFAALGDPTRLALFTRLSDGQARSIASLSADTDLTRQAVTKHLRVLEEAGLVASLRIGRESQFGFRPEPIAAIRAYLDDVSRQWDDALSRLKLFVER
ncbi:MAG: helix-turn-helix transcriptional regulator [Rhizobiales bacterium]|nr:helix-turn-helix transcriptional regulator [Hyphomicrobiales bacterium]